MGLFLCEVCNEQLTKDHICDRQKIIDHIEFLKLQADKHHLQVTQVRDSILFLIKSLPSLDSETVEVKTDLIREVYASAGDSWDGKYKTADSYLIMWIAMHQLLSRAFELFKPKKKGDLLTKMKALKAACLHAKEILQYKNTDISLEPEDVLK
jgi:hypothetical protein